MTEVLQKIFDGLPEDALERELQRVKDEIERLTARQEMILRSLGRGAIDVEQLSFGT